ncbi:calcium-binding protein [Pseudanabaena sp. PCC 6802]|uniref:calcium-binding protein n=1 Tax=Pseudanabaena sp. PCC 6802 TaxID=118173 RepID=UPI00034DA9F9|nr:hypothetical protein [Pseudanabaena sp. PCC 6802]
MNTFEVNTMLGDRALEDSLEAARAYLGQFATAPDFAPRMQAAFGEGIDVADLQVAWRAGDFSGLPRVEVRSPAEINGANGAYAAATDTIYLSRDFLDRNAGNLEPIVSVLLEEMGHAVDARLNRADSLGDEGAIFSALVRGERLTPQLLALLKAKDDSATVTLDGKDVAIEQDNIVGTDGNDNLPGTSGNDTIDGLGGNDVINGLGGDDSLIGGLGNDQVYGDVGNDTLDGGEGDDYLIPGSGVNAIIGGAGTERLDLDYSTQTSNLKVDYSDPNNGTISDDSTLKEVEWIVIGGGSGNDTIDISATTSTDYVLSGAGNDLIVSGSASYDRLEGGDGNDTIRGGVGDEVNAGNLGGIYGQAGDDSLLGEAGNDYLDGGVGNDTLDGGEGDDYLIPGPGVNAIIGGAGTERLDLDYSTQTSNLKVDYSDPNNGTISDDSTLKEVEWIVISGGSGNDTIDISATTSTDYVLSGAGNDLIVSGSASYDRLEGGDGNDTIRGGVGDEVNAGNLGGIYGQAGDDSLLGEAGNDYLDGGVGNDTLDGGEGDDYLIPGPGVNAIIGGAGTERLDLDYSTQTSNLKVDYSDPNNGTISDDSTLKEVEWIVIGGGSGNDTIDISATTSTDYVLSGAGNDLIVSGSASYDRLEGGDGNDTIRGGVGDEVNAGNLGGIYGQAGDDSLLGEAGNDYLDGGSGNDTLDGGSGNERVLRFLCKREIRSVI